MKKTLVAVAALVATGAFAQVTISGLMEIGITNKAVTASGATTTTRTLGDTNGNNQLNFTAKEDLGSGMSADIQFGFGSSGDNSTEYTNYQTFAGVSGGFGRVQMGSFIQPMFLTAITGDATGASTGVPNQKGLEAVANAAFPSNLFSPNQLQYTLPTLVQGLGLSVTQRFGESTSGNGVDDAMSYSASYSGGGLNASYTTTTNQATTTTKNVGNYLGANYDFGMAAVYVGSSSLKAGTAATISASNYGVRVPFGAMTLMAQNATTAAASSSAFKITQSDLGIGYALSKRTSVTYLNSTNKGGTAAANKTVINKVYLQHAF